MTTEPPQSPFSGQATSRPQPQSPSRPVEGAQAPGAPASASPGPQSPAAPGVSGYSGPVPPGGWQQPVPRATAFTAGFILAGWWSRVAAALIDGLALTLLWTLLIAPGVVVTFATDLTWLGIGLWILGGLVATIVALLYAAYFMQRAGAHNGQTPGKQALGIRVAYPDGKRVDWGAALLRELVIKGLLLGLTGAVASFVTFFLFGFGFVIPYILDFLWPLWDEENRAVHDMIVNSRVVKA